MTSPSPHSQLWRWDIQKLLDLIQSGLATAQGAIATLQSQVATLQGQVSTLQGQMANVFTNVTGIQFAATQVPSSDPNTLDDYEEGTWTMTVTTGSGTLGGYTVQEAGYTKIGRMVHVYGRFTVTSVGSGASYYNVAGLPFTSTASAAEMGGMGREAAVNGMGFIFHVRPGLTTAFLTPTDAAATVVGANYQINYSGWYRAA